MAAAASFPVTSRLSANQLITLLMWKVYCDCIQLIYIDVCSNIPVFLSTSYVIYPQDSPAMGMYCMCVHNHTHSRRGVRWWCAPLSSPNHIISLTQGKESCQMVMCTSIFSQSYYHTYTRRVVRWWCVHVSPSAKIATWRYWFHLSRDVYGGNRSFASYTKTKTVESAVWCLMTWLDDGDSQQVTGTR